MAGVKERYDIDNPSKMFVSVSSDDYWGYIFVVGATLKENIDRTVLRQALDDVGKRFPTFFANIDKSGTWYYIVPVSNYDVIRDESVKMYWGIPTAESDKPIFRIFVKDNHITLSLCHVLGDGVAAATVFENILARYFELMGHEIEHTGTIVNFDDEPKDEETVDSFQELYSWRRRFSRKEANSYWYKTESGDGFKNITITMSMAELKALREKYNCTTTILLASVYCMAFYEQLKKDEREFEKGTKLKFSLPIDLRNVFPSKTLRNFALYANIGIRPYERDYSFEGIVEELTREWKEGNDKERLHNMASQNVYEERRWITRLVPMKIKKKAVKVVAHHYSAFKFASTFTNLGRRNIPESLAKHIENFDVFVGAGGGAPVQASAIGFGGHLTFCLNSVEASGELTDYIINYLEELGLNLKVKERFYKFNEDSEESKENEETTD